MPASLQPNDPALVEYLEEKFNSMQRALTNQIGDLRAEINDLRTDLKESHNTIRQLRATVVAQRVTYDDLEQYTRRTSVRVNGIPLLQGEDDRAFDRSKLLAAVNEQITAVHPNLVIQPDDVNRFHRSGKPRTDEETGVRSAPVLIQFKHWEPRSRLHGFYKGLFNSGHTVRIYPDLTKRRLDLSKTCRDQLKESGLANKDCFVYTDINCNLKIRMNNKVSAFNTQDQFDRVLEDNGAAPSR